MAVLKKNEFVFVTGQTPDNALREAPARSISNGEKPDPKIEAEKAEKEREEAERQAKIKEYEQLKQSYIDEGEKQLNEARLKSAEMLEDAGIHAQMLREDAEKECIAIRKNAEEEGYSAGFASGEKPGYDEGYKNGLAQCKDALADLKAAMEKLQAEKDGIFRDYENQLFDLIFTISNKITAGSLKQKDKAVISRMLKEAAKGFRNSAYIKVTLSKLDLEESANVDLDDFRRIFNEGQNIEFEILKDAPSGTLILDNGSEITDAGIMTQLMMIENLGKGKFKNKPDETVDN